jgi:Heparinase II/III-like protein
MIQFLAVAVVFSTQAAAYEFSTADLRVVSPDPIRNAQNQSGVISSVLPDARPRQLASTVFSTPAFWWPAAKDAVVWSFELQALNVGQSGGPRSIQQQLVDKNWLNLEINLAPGAYRWRAIATGNSHRAEHQAVWKQFSVLENAQSFDDRLIGPARLFAATPTRLKQEFSLLHSKVQTDANYRSNLEKVIERTAWLAPGYSAAQSGESAGLSALLTLNAISPALEAIQILSAYIAVTGDAVSCKKIVEHLIPVTVQALGPEFQYKANDMAARSLAFTFWLVLDRCGKPLAESRNNALLSLYNARTLTIVDRFIKQSFDALIARKDFERFPLNSHGWTNLGYLCALAAATKAVLPDSADLLNKSLPVYLNTFMPWASEGDGFGNGSAYAFFAPALKIPIWDLLKTTGTVDLYQHPSMAGLLVYLQTVYPKNSTSTTFGNGAELRSDRKVIEQLAARISPERLRQATDRLDANNTSRWFSSIGEVSLRTGDTQLQIYFRASPYGSFNHSHPDQNSFIVNWKGARLIGRSGTYDAYDSLHYKTWYKTTAAQSTLTFDANEGQVVNSLNATGSVKAVGSSGQFSWVLGDSADAYRNVKRANRLLILRDSGQWLVVDFTELDPRFGPKSATFNLHIPTSNKVQLNVSQMIISSKEQNFCVKLLDAGLGAAGANLSYPNNRTWVALDDIGGPPIRNQGAEKTQRYGAPTALGLSHVIPVFFNSGCSNEASPTIKVVNSQWVIDWGGVQWLLPI